MWVRCAASRRTIISFCSISIANALRMKNTRPFCCSMSFRTGAQQNSAPIVAALRTSLDKRHGSLLSVFTGSSQEGLRKVFSAKDAPFYRFATQMTLPELDEEFIDHQLAVFKSKAKRKIERTDALAVFDKIQRNPLFFQQWLIALMVHSELTPATAIDHVLADIGVQFDFDRIWRGLSGLQRAVLRLLVEQTEQIYAEASTARMASLTGKSAPSNAAVKQRSGASPVWAWRKNGRTPGD